MFNTLNNANAPKQVKFLDSEKYTAAARRFATLHSDFDEREQGKAMIELIDETLGALTCHP